MLLAATFGQDLAEVFPDGGVILLLIFDCRFDQIGEGLDELRSRRVLGRSCLLKCLCVGLCGTSLNWENAERCSGVCTSMSLSMVCWISGVILALTPRKRCP